jgi:hypothetical protein
MVGIKADQRQGQAPVKVDLPVSATVVYCALTCGCYKTEVQKLLAIDWLIEHFSELNGKDWPEARKWIEENGSPSQAERVKNL